MSRPMHLRSLTHLLRDTQGSVLPMLAFGLLMLMTAVGVAIDLSREQTVHAKLNAAMDAATLAAAKSVSVTFPCANQPDTNSCIQNQVSTVGTNYFNTNYANAFGGTGAPTITPTFSYDYVSGNVIGTVNTNVPTTFMQIVGQSSFPVTANTLTQASIFYLGQGVGSGNTFLNPMTYNDSTTGLYSYATPLTAYSSPPVADATFSGNNSIVMRANGFDTISVVPGATVGAGHGTVNDVVIGNYTFTGGTYPEYGPALHFGGITGMGSDDFFLQRYNIAANESALILNMGDDYLSPYGGGGTNVGDVFQIGAQEGVGSTFVPNFQFTSDGHMMIGQFTQFATGTKEGDSTLEIASNWFGGTGTGTSANGIDLEGNPSDPHVLSFGLFVDEQAAGNYNPLVQAHDHAIVALDYTTHAAAIGTGNIFIGPWSSSAFGLYVTQSGTVGINNNTPQVQLDVSGTELINSNSTSGTFASPRIGFVDTSLGSETSAPAWYIDNLNDVFRIFRQPSIGTAGVSYLNVYKVASPAVGATFSFAGTDSNGNTQSVSIAEFDGTINATGWLNGYNVQANATNSAGGWVASDPTGYIQTGNGATSNSGTAVTIGTACSTQGAMAYDTTNNIIIYCNGSTNLWASVAQPRLMLAAGFPKKFVSGNGASGSATYSPYDLCLYTDISASPSGSDTQFEYRITGPGTNKTWNFYAAGSGDGFFATASCYNFE